MRYVSIYPKNSQIREVIDRLSLMDNKHGIAIRTTPQIAVTLSHHKSIRELSSLDRIDIATRHNGPRRSIIYLTPGTNIKKKGEKYYFFF
jgi:hypothetical protein